ncbi:MAG: prepilin-type N-terminal cleavage/methylation domain-containing protein [Planctomycetota bacterium]
MPSTHAPRRPASRRALCHPRLAFTLLEILIVVAILGILAAIVVPQFSTATEQSKENNLKSNLYQIRQQLQVYRADHGDYPSLANFADQMTLASDLDGNTAAVGTAGYPFGPYLAEMPNNPFHDNDAVSDTSVGAGGVGSTAWYYEASTGDFHANSSSDHFAF